MRLLERAHLLHELRNALDRAAAGEGALLLISGEAGIGKSALLRQFAADVHAADGARVLLGHCDALSTPRALAPLLDLAEPALSRLLVEHAPRDLIFRSLLDRLANSPSPILLAIEDAHWADEATLDLIRFLGRRIAATRGVLAITYRDDEVGPRHGLRRVIGDLATEGAVRRLPLPRLTREAVLALAAESAVDPDGLYQRTGGNPFFVTEVLAAGGAIPPTVRDAVLARASRLSPSAWQVLEAAAVIGSPLDQGLLNQVARPTAADLEACLSGGMLVGAGATIAFRHELAREAILSAIPPPRGEALHAAILRALETSPDGALDQARLAHHAEGARDGAAVLRHAPAAARRALGLRAYREAADQFARALRFASRLSGPERASLLEALSHARYRTAQIDLAIAAREEALALWREIGNSRKEGENRCHLAILHWADARMADAEREAAAAATTLEAVPPGPELAFAYGTLARLRGTILDDDDAIRSGERAIAIAERFAATETLADALITVGVARLARGALAEGHAEIERSIALSAGAGLDDLTARAYANLGFGYDEHYQFDIAARHYARGIAFCLERDLDNARQHMSAWYARCQLFLGNWHDASRLAGGLLNARDVAPVTRFVALLVEGLVRIRRGDPEASPLLDEALELAEASGSLYRLGPVRAARAEAAYLRGDRAGVAAEASAALPLALARQQRWYSGELVYWLWKVGAGPGLSAAIAEPIAWQISGQWAEAAAAWDTLGCPYEAARARAEGPDEPTLRSALAAFDDLGAMPAAALIRRRLRSRGARRVPRGPRPSTRRHPAGLTAREVEVLAFLAAGQSNQEIAERLYLSPRTVENHVAAILAKLDAANRAEATLAAQRLGIVPQTG